MQKQKSTNEAQFNNRSTGILSIDRVEKSGIKLEERLAVNDGEVKLSNENIIVIGTNTPANDAFPEHGIDAKKGIIETNSLAKGVYFLKIQDVFSRFVVE